MAQPVSHYDEDEYGKRDDDFELVGEQRNDEPPRGRGRVGAIALTIAVMLLFAGGLWFAYVQGTRHAGSPTQSANTVPLLRADERPTKVRPEQPGGMPMPDQNISLYNDALAKSPVEKLLPPPEQPLPRPAPPRIKPAAAPPTVMPRPEANPAEAVPSPGTTAAASRGRGQQIVPAETGPRAAPPQAAASAPVEKAATEPATAGVRVRLGSLRSPEAAREEWHRLKRENDDLLGRLKANAVSVDLGEKGTYYRIMAGPLNEAAAERLCDEMKRRNQGCIVAR